MSINKDNIGSKAITKKVTECHATIQFLWLACNKSSLKIKDSRVSRSMWKSNYDFFFKFILSMKVKYALDKTAGKNFHYEFHSS